MITNVNLCVLKKVFIQKRDQFVNRYYLQTICKMKILRFLDFEPLIEFRYSSGFFNIKITFVKDFCHRNFSKIGILNKQRLLNYDLVPEAIDFDSGHCVIRLTICNA